jgi:hypothetical protein
MRREESTETEYELIVIEDINPIELFASDKVDPLLKGIAEKAKSFVPNLSTDKSRKEIASMAYKVAQSKTALDKMRLALVADKKAEIKKVDDSGKYMRDCLDYLKAEVREPLTEWEAEEARKVEEARLAEEARVEAERVAKEKAEQLEKERVEKELEDKRLELEKREAELNRKEEERKAIEQAEADEKERIANEARIKKEALDQLGREAAEKIERVEREKAEALKIAEKEKQAAELAKIVAQKKAEYDQKQAVEETERKAKVEADRVELERIQAEKDQAEKLRQEKIVSDRKAANKNHQKRINNEAMEDIIKALGIDDRVGMEIIKAIAKGQIRHISINY